MKKTLIALLSLLLLSEQIYAGYSTNDSAKKARTPVKAAISEKTDTAHKSKYSSTSNGDTPPVMLLPPAQQNLIDLQTMLEILMQEENQSIAATMESIDMVNKTIEFNQGCKAIFLRDENEHSNCGHKHLPGPAGSLKLAYILCN